ncbi:MAG TPA: hypothetical protein VM470_02325 [Acidimicrobiia bacterium]|nr:hypothetical protein [Acidimicrobiia bacterium]
MTNSMPTINPATTAIQTAEGQPDAAVDLATLEEVAMAPGPQLVPPTEVAATTGISAWLTGKRIFGLWSNASPRNSWISIEGVGWRRLHNAGDTGITEMTMIAAHARAGGRQCSIRVEADNLVHEIYVW